MSTVKHKGFRDKAGSRAQIEDAPIGRQSHHLIRTAGIDTYQVDLAADYMDEAGQEAQEKVTQGRQPGFRRNKAVQTELLPFPDMLGGQAERLYRVGHGSPAAQPQNERGEQHCRPREDKRH